ncbi:lipid transfer protein [Grosmannia clavigera kw1407]|uniref:Lipid transfer protein n=1 Tax=Grosmannia clavigera (strain kw1407 / UAMH 11150) TaxID=655863 RepID=F0XSN6_GROCL|nr:lipid transfer protein [Grosmannia clavigera kw1407]EFW99359.1 lipid transfer protein [Grosmannia clavigera kw1407]
MPLQNEKYPSSVAFDAINDALANDDFKKEAIKQAKAVFGITLKNPAGETESWFIDLAKEGKVVQGLDKSDVELRLSDEDFGKLVLGKAKAQSLFMSGKLKIKGNVMKAAKLEPILNKAQGQTKAKL